MQDFHELKVWQKAHALTLRVYRESRAFPTGEQFGLTAQLRRTAASIGANIAEGCGRGTSADFARFLHIATGSASELEYHVLLAGDLGFLSGDVAEGLTGDVAEVKRMLSGLLLRVREAQPQRCVFPVAKQTRDTETDN